MVINKDDEEKETKVVDETAANLWGTIVETSSKKPVY